MWVHELTKEEYLETMDEMTAITEEYEALVDIWRYAEKLKNKNLLSEHMYERRLVEAAYKNSENSFHHVLLFGRGKNIYLVIVIDVEKSEILGHYFLDLNSEYGLSAE